MTAHDSDGVRWPDGTHKTTRNAFTIAGSADKLIDFKREQANAARSIAATRTKERHARAGKPLADIGRLSARPYFPEVRGAARSQADNDKSAAIRKGSIGGPLPKSTVPGGSHA